MFKNVMLASATLLMVVSLAAAGGPTVVWEEDFETDVGGATLDPSGMGSNPADTGGYWGRHDNVSDTDAIFTNVSGEYWLGGTDIDNGTGGDTIATATYVISIAGYTDLQFTGLFGAAQNKFEDKGSSNPELQEHIRIIAQIDGGTQQELLSFTADGDNSSLYQNGSGTELTKAMQQFSTAISGTGDMLTLIVSVRSSHVEEAAAVDNLQITAVPEPMTMSLLAVGGLALLRRRRA